MTPDLKPASPACIASVIRAVDKRADDGILHGILMAENWLKPDMHRRIILFFTFCFFSIHFWT
jgi:hypothetical protein